MISSSLAQDYLIPGDLGSLDFDHIHPEGFPSSARFSGGARSIHLSYSPNDVLVMIIGLPPAIKSANSAAAMMPVSHVAEQKTNIFTLVAVAGFAMGQLTSHQLIFPWPGTNS